MAIEAHIKALKKKHEDLEKELEAALASPSADDLLIADLKKKKLQLKDEISKAEENAK